MEIKIIPSIHDFIHKLIVKFMNQGLRLRLGLALTIISLVPLLTLGFFSYIKSSDTVRDITNRYANDIIGEVSINMFLSFKNIDDISKVIINNNVVKEILSKEEGKAADDYYYDNSIIGSLLKSISYSNNYIKSVYILSEKSNNIFAVGDVTGNYGLGFFTDDYRVNYKTSELYKETINEPNNYKWWPTENVLGKNVFILTRKLYDVEKGLLGVLVVHVNVDIMNDIYRRINNGKYLSMYLMDEDGMILYHSDEIQIGKMLDNKEIFKKVSSQEKGSFTLNQNKKRIFTIYNTFFITRWKLIAGMPYNSLTAESDMIRNVTLIVAFISFIFVGLLSILISRGILKPVKKFIQLMRKGSEGDIEVRFNILYRDEIGQMGDSFNKMMIEIQKLIQMVEVENKQKVEAQIKALEAHINPHFLYNTLASIYWMAMAEGNTKLAKMASSLSNFFRLGLNKGNEFTTVEKEVEHVRSYLNIQKIRYGDKLEFEIEVEQQIFICRTIKLILQPLVENSIKHGLDLIREKGFIKIEVYKRENFIIFRVIDNGPGIPHLGEIGIQGLINSGYGLKNVNERLKLYFGDDYTIYCTSIPDKETVFEISIPVIIASEVGSLKEIENF